MYILLLQIRGGGAFQTLGEGIIVKASVYPNLYFTKCLLRYFDVVVVVVVIIIIIVVVAVFAQTNFFAMSPVFNVSVTDL